MRSSLVVRASDRQCTSCNGPGFDPSIRRHSGIWGAADESVLNTYSTKKIKNPPPPPKKKDFGNLSMWKQRAAKKMEKPLVSVVFTPATPSHHGSFGSYLPSRYSWPTLYACAGSPKHIWLERFRGIQKEDGCEPLSIQSSLGESEFCT